MEHFRGAFEEGMADELAEVDAIAANREPPTFFNTVVALERTGRALNRASRVFYLLASSDTNEAIQQIQAEFAPRFAAHSDAIMLNRALFARIDAVFAQRDSLDLAAEDRRLLERYHLDYVRAGAALQPAEQQRLATLNAELATLATRFGNNLLADTNESAVLVADVADLEGLAPDTVSAAAEAARSRGLDGYLLTLVLPTHQPALESLRRGDVRRRLLSAAQTRGSRAGEHDNRGLVGRIATLRAERAELLGFRTHSDYVLADRTALDNDTLDAMLLRIIPAALSNARREEQDLAVAKAADGDPEPFAAWDWAYYAQAVKRARYSFDTNTLRPYFEVMRTLEHGVFYAAEQLYGITFRRRPDLTSYHPDAIVYEVIDADGSGLGLFIGDYFTRDSKRGGAWMESLVTQSHLLGQRPVVVNNMNLSKPPDGQPALMNLDEVGTMFHEFGHALHGLFSSVSYPRLAGTAVARDFVEYPSQVNEMWLTCPAVLGSYARHVDDGSPLPDELATRLVAAETFNQGFDTVSYLGATWIDLAWHRLTLAEAREASGDVDGFERRALAGVGLDVATVPPRYRGPYFNHVFGGGYSSGYYSYIWSEVLDADTV
ncbi:MAG: peptidyl-dipeptidase Dcp, partial [Frankiales bacterium]|nr:peptidyl-dipeptidase Dcp [Frankiales bacterium]